MKSKSLRARPRLSGPAVFGFTGFTLLAGCQKEAPIDPEAMAQQASDSAAAVFASAALSAQGNRGAETATSRLGNGLGTISSSFEQVPLDTGSSGSPSPTPYIRQRSALKYALQSVPALRAMLRPLATESLLGPSPLSGDLGVFNATAEESSELASNLDDTGQLLRRLLRERILAAAQPGNQERQRGHLPPAPRSHLPRPR